MISIDEAVGAVKKNLPGPGVETVAPDEALHRRIAVDFAAPEPSPRFDNSAMDGFAVRWEDVCGAAEDNPVELEVAGESRAGTPFAGTVGPGQAVRISTGAMMPQGADTVVRVEDTVAGGKGVRIVAVRKKGQDVRYAGEEYRAGDVLIKRGTWLAARHLALLAAAGVAGIEVFARPRVALLVTGSELVSAGEGEPGPGQIRDSNRLMLAAAVAEAGGEVVHQGRVRDDLDATTAAIETAMAARPEVIVCAGGVSVGPHDHVRAASVAAGFSEIFWRVRQKPGKPLFLAGSGKTLLFGLPGNPVSAYVCFQHYIKPALSVLGGGEWGWRRMFCVCGGPMENRGRRPNFARVRIEEGGEGPPRAFPLGRQGSHMLTSIAAADGYVHLGPGEVMETGDAVEVFVF